VRLSYRGRGGACGICYQPWRNARADQSEGVLNSVRLKDLLGPVTRVKKKKKKVLNAVCRHAQDLVQSRDEVEAFQLRGGEAPAQLRMLLGRLSPAPGKRLHLVDCVRHEERRDQTGKYSQFHVFHVVLAQP